MNQGFLRMMVLSRLDESPLSGYQLVKAIADRTGWKPSFGSIYPLLERLAADDLVTTTVSGRSKVYALTAKGRETYRAERERREDVHQRILEQVKVLASTGDEEAIGMVALFERRTNGGLPFFHLPEFAAMRHEVQRLARQDSLATHEKALRAVFARATKALRKL